jgi:peptidoglycan/LPS O-acetylase OafA/YrhL
MKAAFAVAASLLVLSLMSLLQGATELSSTSDTIQAEEVAQVLFALALSSYAAVWPALLRSRRRSALLFTAFAVLCPAGMIVYNAVAIWLRNDEFVLKVCVTFSLAAILAIYLRVGSRWWGKLQNEIRI